MIKVDHPGQKLAWQEERRELGFRKKSRRDEMMHSKSFEIQEVREVDQKEAKECKGFPILQMGVIEDVFQMEERNVDQKR